MQDEGQAGLADALPHLSDLGDPEHAQDLRVLPGAALRHLPLGHRLRPRILRRDGRQDPRSGALFNGIN